MVYSLIYNSNNVIRDSDQAIIPSDPHNSDWQKYQAWLAANNIPTSATVPVLSTPVPGSVYLWQAKAALQQAGLLTESDAAIAAMNNIVLNQYWNNGVTIDRTSNTLLTLANTIGLSSANVDALFIAASTISL